MATHKTCSNYCGAQGLGCVNGWEEDNEKCTSWQGGDGGMKGCWYDFDFWEDTSDALCQCAAPVGYSSDSSDSSDSSTTTINAAGGRASMPSLLAAAVVLAGLAMV